MNGQNASVQTFHSPPPQRRRQARTAAWRRSSRRLPYAVTLARPSCCFTTTVIRSTIHSASGMPPRSWAELAGGWQSRFHRHCGMRRACGRRSIPTGTKL